MSNLPSNWASIGLLDISTLVRGVTYTKADARDLAFEGSISVLRANNIQDHSFDLRDLVHVPASLVSSTQRIRKGDVVVATSSGSISVVGKAAQASSDMDAGFGAFCGLLRPNDEINAEYFGHYFSSNAYRTAVSTMARGVNINNLKRDHFNALIIPLAPLPEQKRIADKLDAVLARVDACRDRLDRIPAILKRFRQSVLAAATSGKLTEDWRANQVARMEPQAESGNIARDSAQSHYVVTAAPDSATLHPGYEALEIGLPNTWSICQIKDAGRIQLGRQRSPKFHAGENMRPYLRVQNIFEDRLDLSDVMEMDFPGQDIERYQLHPGDILLNEGQSPEYLGRPAMYRGELPGACFTNTLIRFQAYSHVIADFALLVFRHHMHSGRYRSEGTITTNIAHLGAGRFSNVDFPLPPLNEQTEIVRRVEALFACADRFEARYAAARAQVEKLTPATLAKAFRGELVPQDPNDEPASALLERIRAQRGDRPRA